MEPKRKEQIQQSTTTQDSRIIPTGGGSDDSFFEARGGGSPSAFFTQPGHDPAEYPNELPGVGVVGISKFRHGVQGRNTNGPDENVAGVFGTTDFDKEVTMPNLIGQPADPKIAGLFGENTVNKNRIRTVMTIGLSIMVPMILVIGQAWAKPCRNFKVYGLIGDQYRRMGGADGPFGCPCNDEADIPGGTGRYNQFEKGQIVWSPKIWPHSVQAAYYAGMGVKAVGVTVPDTSRPGWVRQTTRAVQFYRIKVLWTDTSPFNYEFFIVRWDMDGNNVGQADVRGGSRTEGAYDIEVNASGRYRIVIEGCDGRFLAPSKCRQGWTNPLYVNVPAN